jgi:hypothetical protein
MTDDLHEQVQEVLFGWPTPGSVVGAHTADEMTAALLPVVRAWAAQQLRDAADTGGHAHWVSTHDLRDRANALGEPGA